MSILDEIVAHKRVEVAERAARQPLSEVERAAEEAPPVRDFTGALASPRYPAPRVIAEVKRRSPSRGELRPGLDPAAVASVYAQNGAAAISVLTDSRYFGGSLTDLTAAREAVSISVLCKEFIVEPYQIYEARCAGADAVLLIAAVLPPGGLREMRVLAERLGMAALVEAHNAEEVEAALESGARIVGINNRDLHTFAVSLDTTRALRPLIPAGVITVSESGIHSPHDRDAMRQAGVDALLVGEGLLASHDLEGATRLICGLANAEREAQTAR